MIRVFVVDDSAIVRKKLTEDLDSLINGDSINVKEYHFNAPPDKNVLITIEPSELLIVEGLFLFHFEGVRSKLDYSIFIEVDPEIQLDRRLYRDQETRGYSREDIMYQWENHVIPCYDNYLLPYRDEADFKFRNDNRANDDFEILAKGLKQNLELISNEK